MAAIFLPTQFKLLKKILSIFLLLFIPFFLTAQSDTTGNGVKDSVPSGIDSVQRRIDSIAQQRIADSLQKRQDSITRVTNMQNSRYRIESFQRVLREHPYYKFFAPPFRLTMQERVVEGDEQLFYLLLFFVALFALVRQFFPRYTDTLFTLFFRATMRQQQLREQMLQTPVPSFLLNLLFIFTGGIYTVLLARYYKVLPNIDFWWLWLYSVIVLLGIYLGKFVVLKTVGWILRMNRASDVYIFVVFLVNKMAGIFLLPILFLLAFPPDQWKPVVVTLSLFGFAILLLYRFFVSYRLVRSEIKLNLFHFFIYLCAFEIAPLLLIYKALLTIVIRTN